MKKRRKKEKILNLTKFIIGLVILIVFSLFIFIQLKSSLISTKAVTTKCTDTDSGDDYYVRGEVTSALGVTTEDTCVNDTLLNEHSCPPQEYLQSGTQITAYNCPNGCNDGACILTNEIIPTNYDLKSNLFKNDPEAISVIRGENYTIFYSNLYPYMDVDNSLATNVSSFNFKLINALKQLGYSNLNPYSFLNQFQEIHNLPISNDLDKTILIQIDSELFLTEERDKFDSARYAPSITFIDSPENEPPKEHLAALYHKFFQALPVNMPYDNGVARTIDEFRMSLVFGMAGNFGEMINPEGNRVLTFQEKIDVENNKQDFKFCSNAYYSGFNEELYGGNCINPPKMLANWWPTSDYNYFIMFTHEFGHGIGSIKIIINGVEDRIDEQFGKISFINSPYYDSYNNQISNVTWIRLDNNYGEFVTPYSRRAGGSDNGPSSVVLKEDFAESFRFYLLEGKIFRERAKKNIYLQQKYDFLKQYVFKGKEYDTGNIDFYNSWLSKNPDATPLQELTSSGSVFESQGSNKVWVWKELYPIYNNGSESIRITSSENNTSNYICSDCELDNQCYPLGYRKSDNYCSDETKEFVPQLDVDEICENNFQCQSNICVESKCISASLWLKFLDWIKNLFGG